MGFQMNTKKSIDKSYALKYHIDFVLTLNEEQVKKAGYDVDAFKHWCDKKMILSPVEVDNTQYPNSFEASIEFIHDDNFYDLWEEAWKQWLEIFINSEYPNGVEKHYPKDEIDANQKSWKKFSKTLDE